MCVWEFIYVDYIYERNHSFHMVLLSATIAMNGARISHFNENLPFSILCCCPCILVLVTNSRLFLVKLQLKFFICWWLGILWVEDKSLSGVNAKLQNHSKFQCVFCFKFDYPISTPVWWRHYWDQRLLFQEWSWKLIITKTEFLKWFQSSNFLLISISCCWSHIVWKDLCWWESWPALWKS